MNWIVISLGTALVLALFAALVGPYFVDWTAYRTVIEANAERVLGTRVAIDGEAELRLLPSPRMRLTDVRLGDAARPLLAAEAVELDVELTPLLRGELRIQELRLDAPTLAVTVGENGRIEMPDIADDPALASLFSVGSIAVDDIHVDAGTIAVTDRRSGTERRVTDIALAGRAQSLRGPFNATGTLRIDGALQDVQIGAGALEADTMPLSARLQPAEGDLSVSFEGALVPRVDAPALRGELAVVATGSPAWSLRGELRASPQAITLNRGTARYGTGEAALELGLSGRYDLATAEPLAVALEARQLDLDRIARGLGDVSDPPAIRPPATWTGALARHLAPLFAMLEAPGTRDTDLTATLDIDTLVAGGALVRDVSAAVGTNAAGLSVERAEALLPGDTALDVAGRLTEAGFAGRLRASSAQPALLARWWTGSPLPGGAMNPAVVDADFDAGAGGLDAPRVSLRVGQSSGTGRLTFRPATATGTSPSLALALAAPRLDLADLADVWAMIAAAGLEPAGTPDILVDLSAQEVLLGSTTGAALNFDASYKDGLVTIDALSAEDIAGARLFASGAIGDLFGTPVGAIEGTLVLEDGARLGAALGTLAGSGGGWFGGLARRAEALAPADLRFALSGGSGAAGDSANGLSLTLDGTSAGTTLTADLALAAPGPAWREAPARLSLSARNADASALLAQAGITASTEAPGEGNLDIDFDGIPAEGMDGRATLDLLGLAADFEGRLAFTDTLAPRGTLSLAADDLTALANAFDRALPELGALSLTASVAPQAAGGVSLAALTGEVDGTAITGSLAADASGLSGALDVSQLDLAALVGWAMLGEDPMAAPTWSSTTFGTPFDPPFPVSLALTAGELSVGALAVTDARMALTLGSDRLAIADLDATYAGGVLGGKLDLSREGARADLSGALSLDGADLSSIVWQDADGEPVATGRLSVDGAFSSSSYTVSGLVAGLSGEGIASLGNARLAGLNAGPVAALAGDTLPDEAEAARVIADHLAAGALTFDTLEATLTLSGGTLRTDEMTIDADDGKALASASLDLSAGTLRGDVIVTLTPPGSEGIAIDVTFDGPLAAPRRTVDVSALVAFINLKELERRVKAVEAQNKELEAEANRLDPLAAGTADAPPAAQEDNAPSPEDDGTSTPPAGDAPSTAPAGASDTSPAADAPTDTAPTPAPGTPLPLPAPGTNTVPLPPAPPDQRGALRPNAVKGFLMLPMRRAA